MSLLILFAGASDDGEPEPPAAVPFRTLMGVGLTLALLAAPAAGILFL